MKCPQCGSGLVSRQFESISVDKCPVCRGVWFDSGELSLLVQEMKKGELRVEEPGPRAEPTASPFSACSLEPPFFRLTEAPKAGTMLSTVYKMRGVAYAKKGQYALALNDMTKSISLQSKEHDAAVYLPSTYYARGAIYYKLGNRELAVADFRMAADLEPENIEYAKARYKMDEAEFQREAQCYREMQVKPTLTEEARKYAVQAETAIKQKSFKDAVGRYEDALKIAPWWPEGDFNMALILAELSRYTEAALEMKRYLLLVPNAPDAQAAQDKIYEWEGLANKPKGP